jgi:O-antigen ligase
LSALRKALLLALLAGLAGSITLAQAALVALAVDCLVRRGAPPWRTLRRAPLALPLGLFAGWTVAAALLSARPAESLPAAKSLLTLGAFYVVLAALPDGRAARWFGWGLLVAVAAAGLVGLVQVVACVEPPPAQPLAAWLLRKCTRARGLFSIYMTLGGVLMLVLVSTLPRLARPDPARRWALPAWLAGAAGLAATYVRGAWVGFAAGALLALAGARRRALALGALALVVAAALAAPGVATRARTIVDLGHSTVLERLAMLRAGLAMARDHALTGTGPGQVKHLYPTYAPPEAVRRHTSHLHNTPLQILVERGVPGLFLWGWVFAAFFARGVGVLRALPAERDADRALVTGSLAALAAFLVAGLFEHNFGDTEVLQVACALMALPFVVAREGPAA